MTERLDTGDIAPTVTLTGADGAQVSLDDLRGSRAVVYFYPKAFTPGCTTEACDFRDNEASFAERGYRVVGISADSPERLGEFAKEHDLPFTLLSDPESRTARAWGAWGRRDADDPASEGPVRTTVVLDAEGAVVSAEYGVAAQGHVTNLLGTLRP